MSVVDLRPSGCCRTGSQCNISYRSCAHTGRDSRDTELNSPLLLLLFSTSRFRFGHSTEVPEVLSDVSRPRVCRSRNTTGTACSFPRAFLTLLVTVSTVRVALFSLSRAFYANLTDFLFLFFIIYTAYLPRRYVLSCTPCVTSVFVRHAQMFSDSTGDLENVFECLRRMVVGP